MSQNQLVLWQPRRTNRCAVALALCLALGLPFPVCGCPPSDTRNPRAAGGKAKGARRWRTGKRAIRRAAPRRRSDSHGLKSNVALVIETVTDSGSCGEEHSRGAADRLDHQAHDRAGGPRFTTSRCHVTSPSLPTDGHRHRARGSRLRWARTAAQRTPAPGADGLREPRRPRAGDAAILVRPRRTFDDEPEARELGMQNTRFVDPPALPSANVSTGRRVWRRLVPRDQHRVITLTASTSTDPVHSLRSRTWSCQPRQ